MKKIAILCIMVLLLGATASATLCTHTPRVVGERITYQLRIDGHIKKTEQTLYCEICDDYGTKTIEALEGHNYLRTGHWHDFNSNTHEVYYECIHCDYTTTYEYYCRGNPCSIAMSVPEDVVVE